MHLEAIIDRSMNDVGLHGFVDKLGNEVIPLKYLHVSNFSEGVARVRQEMIYRDDSYTPRLTLKDEYSYIDKLGNGAILTKPFYVYIGDFHEGLTIVKSTKTRKTGFINKLGDEVIKCKYDSVKNFFEGLAEVKLNGNYGLINKSGIEYWED